MTHWRTMSDASPYLASYDLATRDGKPVDVDLRIDHVEAGQVVGENGKKDKRPIVHFAPRDGKQAPKPLVLNATNGKTITSIVGSPDVERWAGQWITVYQTDTTDKRTKETVRCIRIRPTAPKRTSQADPAEATK